MLRVRPVAGIVFGGPSASVSSRYEELLSGARIKRDRSETYKDLQLPGVGVIPIQGKSLRIPPGLRTSWKTGSR